MSRPFLPRDVRRNNSVTARFTDEEYTMMKSIARCDGTTLSNTVRELCVIGIRVQTKRASPCETCELIHDTKGNIEVNMDTLDPKCFKCLVMKMKKAEDNIPLVV
ncbi:MAG: hypothetical protein WC319_02435 [Candidatus Paceibacterota bacterium]